MFNLKNKLFMKKIIYALLACFMMTIALSANAYVEEEEAVDEIQCQFVNKKNPTFKRGCKAAPGWVCMPC